MNIILYGDYCQSLLNEYSITIKYCIVNPTEQLHHKSSKSNSATNLWDHTFSIKKKGGAQLNCTEPSTISEWELFKTASKNKHLREMDLCMPRNHSHFFSTSFSAQGSATLPSPQPHTACCQGQQLPLCDESVPPGVCRQNTALFQQPPPVYLTPGRSHPCGSPDQTGTALMAAMWRKC